MNILITGVAGFVGSSLARAILARTPDARITGIDDFSFGYRERLADLQGRIEFIEGDVADLPRHLGTRGFDAIVHCAAIAPLPECQRDSHRALVQNVAQCGSVADFALASGTRDIVFLSSGAIYEGVSTFPTPEGVDIRTSLVYPTTKHLAELYFEAMCRSHGLNVTAIRLFNLYGPHQDYFRKQPPLIGYLLSCLIRGEEAVLFSSGEQSRDYVYIDDLLDLLLRSAQAMQQHPAGGHFLAVNAGSGVPVSVNRLIGLLEDIAGRRLALRRLPNAQYWDKYPELFERAIALDRGAIEREVDKHTQADARRAHQALGWSARVALQDGLAACYRHALTVIPH